MKELTPSRFDPRNEKYNNAKHSELPPIMRDDYVEAEGGGFISKETAAEHKAMEISAKMINRHRSLKDKVLGRNKETAIGLEQEVAIAMNDENFPFPENMPHSEKYQRLLKEEAERSSLEEEIAEEEQENRDALEKVRERFRSDVGI